MPDYSITFTYDNGKPTGWQLWAGFPGQSAAEIVEVGTVEDGRIATAIKAAQDAMIADRAEQQHTEQRQTAGCELRSMAVIG